MVTEAYSKETLIIEHKWLSYDWKQEKTLVFG